MIIKNITGGRDNAAKVIGIGPYWLQPDEEKNIPDSVTYVDEVDEEGHKTGKKIILPAIQAQVQKGMLQIKETKKSNKPETKAVEPAAEPVVEPAETEAPVVEEKRTRRSKKAE